MENETIIFTLPDGSYFKITFIPSENHVRIKKNSHRGDDTIIIKPVTLAEIKIE